jgi:hypothetical protein
MGGAHSEEPWDVQPQPGDRMEGQGGTRGAKEIVQGPGKVLECWSAIGARVKRRLEAEVVELTKLKLKTLRGIFQMIT